VGEKVEGDNAGDDAVVEADPDGANTH